MTKPFTAKTMDGVIAHSFPAVTKILQAKPGNIARIHLARRRIH
jgi:hypothetical protein